MSANKLQRYEIFAFSQYNGGGETWAEAHESGETDKDRSRGEEGEFCKSKDVEKLEAELNALKSHASDRNATPETDTVSSYEGNWDTKALRMTNHAKRLERDRDTWRVRAIAAEQVNNELHAQNAELLDALKYYASPEVYNGPNQLPHKGFPETDGGGFMVDVTRDYGSIAKSAIENAGGEA